MITGTKHLPINFCRTGALSIKATVPIKSELDCCTVLTGTSMNSTGVNTCSRVGGWAWQKEILSRSHVG